MATVPAERVKAEAQRAASRRARTSVRYWLCLGLLLAAAIGVKGMAGAFGLALRKAPVPLKKSLHAFDTQGLGPRYELNRELTGRIPRLSEDMIDSLGTEEYWQGYLTDTSRKPGDPARIAMVMITYYTGSPDLVPHVAEECWRAAGKEQRSSGNEPVRAVGVGAPGDLVPVRVQEYVDPRFGRLGPEPVDTVMYFFHANGEYQTTRNGVRASMANPLQRFAYYAKVEVTFNDGGNVRASRAESVAALGPLLERLLPVLFREHFDLEKFAAGAASTGPAPG